MPLDASIPLQAKTVQNPFEQIAQPIQVAQGLQALKQSQMQLGANQAISQAYSQSLNPDGSVDFNKLQSLAGQNGAGAFLPQFMSQIATQRNQQQQYDTSKLEMALKRQANLRQSIGSMALDPDIGKVDKANDIANGIVELVNNGTLPMDRAIQEIRNIPSDPGQQKAYVNKNLYATLQGEAALQAYMPKMQIVNTGSAQYVVPFNPMTGQQAGPSTAFQNTLTPAEAASRISAVGPNGQPGTIPLGSTLPSSQGGYTGRFNQQGGASPDGTPAGFVATGLSPAEQAASTAKGTSSNTAAQALHDAAADVPMRINLLQQARDALSGIDTGPGTAIRNEAKSFLNALAPDTAKAIGYTGDVKNYDEFKKIMTNYASSVSGSLGSGTDARLNAAVTGNANPGISKMANEDILTKTMAAEKMRAAQDYAFQQSGLSTDKFNQWQSQWNKAVNPDAFVFSEMSPTQQQAFIKRQSPAQLAKFKSDLGNLVRSGVISMPGQ